MKVFFTFIYENLWTSIPIVFAFIFQGILLLTSNRLEEITLSARQVLIKKITKIVLLSFISTIILSGIIFIFAADEISEYLTSFMVIVFFIYVITLTLLLPSIEKNSKTYFYICEDQKILFIQKSTIDKRIILTSIPNIDYKTSEGFIMYAKPDFLNDKKIYFISPKRKNFFWQDKLDPSQITVPI